MVAWGWLKENSVLSRGLLTNTHSGTIFLTINASLSALLQTITHCWVKGEASYQTHGFERGARFQMQQKCLTSMGLLGSLGMPWEKPMFQHSSEEAFP